MARHPLPTAIHEANGSFEHDPQRRRPDEPVPTGPLGDPPEWFNDLQRDTWHELAGQVAPGVLTIADRVLVEIYCRLVARMRAGAYLKAAETNQIISILARMGMTPADRSKLRVTPEEKQERDPFAQLAAAPRVVAIAGRTDVS